MAFLKHLARWRSCQAVLKWLLVAGATTATLAAQPSETRPEYKIKAGYLYTFTRYTEWPATAFTNATSPIVVGVLGEDPFGETLDQVVQGRVSQGRPVTVRRSRRVEDLQACQVVFICRSEKNRLAEIIATLRNTNALTVCDVSAFLNQGVMIHLTVVDQAVRFEVEIEPAQRAGLRFNSRMLDAAKRVGTRSKARME